MTNRERFDDFVAEFDHNYSNDELMRFWQLHQGGRGAKVIGFVGPESRKYVKALANYAANLATAKTLRLQGKISRAIEYEKIADKIYNSSYEGNVRRLVKRNPARGKAMKRVKISSGFVLLEDDGHVFTIDNRYLGTVKKFGGTWFYQEPGGRGGIIARSRDDAIESLVARKKNPARAMNPRKPKQRGIRWKYYVGYDVRSGKPHVWNEYRASRVSPKAFARDNGLDPDTIKGPYSSYQRAKAAASAHSKPLTVEQSKQMFEAIDYGREMRASKKNPVRITKGASRAEYHLYTRSPSSAKWSLTVKTNNIGKLLKTAVKLRDKGYGVKVTRAK